MGAMGRLCARIFLVLLPPSAVSLCLEDGVPEQNRRYLSDTAASADESRTPIRMVMYDWGSAEMASTLTHILVTEHFGYHAVMNQQRTLGSFDGVLELAGCTTEDCSQRYAESHIAMECWMSEIPFQFARFAAEHPDKVPFDLGSIGYFGENSLSVRGTVRDDAYFTSGLSLEFYKSYNTTLHHPKLFFDSITDLDINDFALCNTTGNNFANDVEMRAYGRWTGDWDGLEETESGYIAKCTDGHFWISPACRHNTSECIPILAAGDGWIVYVFMQWSAFFGMPTAIGISRSWQLFTANVKAFRTLFHWWIPDATFMQQQGTLLQFPRHRKLEWAEGRYRTADRASNIVKLVSQSLAFAHPKLREFLQNIDLELEEMEGMLLAATNGTAVHDVACQWIRSHRSRWAEWLPDDTKCNPGYGLEDANGSHVPERATAVGCSLCLAGMSSEPMSDDAGETYRCTLCPSGKYQNMFGETSCSSCDIGTFTNVSGAAHCERCRLGYFANSSGASECQACSGEHRTTSRRAVSDGLEKWIEVDGATSDTFCGCVEDWFQNSAGVCEWCMQGSTCPGSSQIELLPGFFSTREEPGMVYRCFGQASRCPGGPPGTCAAGRDPTTVTCDRCLPGHQRNADGTCAPCTGTSYALIVSAIVMVVAGIAFLYALLVLDSERATQPGHTFVGVVALSQLITLIQQLVVVNKFGIDWVDPMKEIFSSLEVVGLDLDMLAVSCVATLSPVSKYAFTVSATPLLAVVALLLHFSALAIKRRMGKKLQFKLDFSHLLRTVGSLFLILYISVFSAILAPFQCNMHPNSRTTLQEYDSVFCNLRDAHLQMSAIGAAATLMPISFLVFCIHLTVFELPKRVRVADASYIRACSFLWQRFRPGAELFAIFILGRNALTVLCPLIPATSVKLVTMNILLYTSLVLVALGKPWRVPASNVLDIILHIGLLVVLDVASMFESPNKDTLTATIICLVFLLIMLFAIGAAIIFGLILHIARLRRKPWKFFLSHHKRAAGGIARLLKIQLQKRGSGYTTFLDTDNLSVLTELFSCVRDTETLVVLATPGILARKWCIGEIVTARLHSIRTVVLRWPQYTDPNEAFQQNLTFAIPGVEALTAYSISLDDVAETLRWFQTVDSIAVPGSWSLEVVGHLCDTLTGRPGPPAEEARTPDVIILADPGNQEAVATAYVIVELLLSSTAARYNAPLVLKKGDGIPENFQKSLLICSSGCFESEDLATWLIDLAPLRPSIIPIIAEPGFAVPTEPFERVAAGLAGALTKTQLQSYAEIIGGVFQEIATVFTPQSYSSSEEDLELRVKQIAFRLQSKSSRLRLTEATGSLREEQPVEDDFCI